MILVFSYYVKLNYVPTLFTNRCYQTFVSGKCYSVIFTQNRNKTKCFADVYVNVGNDVKFFRLKAGKLSNLIKKVNSCIATRFSFTEVA